MGKINFLDNQVDAGTGTLRARASSTTQGMFPACLWLRIPIGKPQAILYAKKAQTDQASGSCGSSTIKTGRFIGT